MEDVDQLLIFVWRLTDHRVSTDEGRVLGLWILEDEAILCHCEVDLPDFYVIFVFDLDQRVDALMHPR